MVKVLKSALPFRLFLYRFGAFGKAPLPVEELDSGTVDRQSSIFGLNAVKVLYHYQCFAGLLYQLKPIMNWCYVLLVKVVKHSTLKDL